MTDVPDALLTEFGPGQVVTDPETTAPFLTDWYREEKGRALAVLRPRTTAEVQAMVRACARLGLEIVPQGGNTGLVNGGLAQNERQVCLSLGRLNRIRSIVPDDYSAIVEAGCVLQTVKEAVAAEDMFLPLTIGSQGSCQIGGVISTNAGGINVLRYGMMRDQVLGLEVVLADGTLWDGLLTLRKNNTGPDLKQLFIGAEGTFGIVTAAALRLVPRPASRAAALIGLPDLPSTMRAYHLARRACSDLLSAFEFLMPPAMEVARSALPGAPMLTTPAGVYALVELAAPGPVDLGALLEGFLEQGLAEGLILDGILAASESQASRIWALREAVNEGAARLGPHLRSDVSVRLSSLPDFVLNTCAAIEADQPGVLVQAFGHFGDGNVHVTVHPSKGSDPVPVMDRAKKVLNAGVDRWGGSISAEHGIGRLKRADFDSRLTEPARSLLASLRRGLDPDGRMNTGSLHPDSTAG